LDSVRWDIKDFVNWVTSDNPNTKYKSLLVQSGVDPNNYPKGTQEMVFYPTNKLRVPVNKENVLKSGVVKPEDADLIVPYVDIDLPKTGISKNQFMMLDILANNDWERPIYFTGGSYDDAEYIWMKEYLQLDGLVYKLVPIQTPLSQYNPYLMGRIDSDLMYDIVMRWSWGNSERSDIYHDPETRKNSISFRSNMARLAEELINEGNDQKALEIIDLALEKMPVDFFGYYSLLVPFVDGYYRLGASEKGAELLQQIAAKYADRLQYFASLNINDQYQLGEEVITEIERYRTLTEALLVHADRTIMEEELDRFVAASKPFVFLYGPYDFYTELIDVVEGYYLANNSIKAQSLAEQILETFNERMNLYGSFSAENQMLVVDRIKSEIMDFQNLVMVVGQQDSTDFRNQITQKYNQALEGLLGEENLEE